MGLSLKRYSSFPKSLDALDIYWNHCKIQTKRFYHRVLPPKGPFEKGLTVLQVIKSLFRLLSRNSLI